MSEHHNIVPCIMFYTIILSGVNIFFCWTPLLCYIWYLILLFCLPKEINLLIKNVCKKSHWIQKKKYFQQKIDYQKAKFNLIVVIVIGLL